MDEVEALYLMVFLPQVPLSTIYTQCICHLHFNTLKLIVILIPWPLIAEIGSSSLYNEHLVQSVPADIWQKLRSQFYFWP